MASLREREQPAEPTIRQLLTQQKWAELAQRPGVRYIFVGGFVYVVEVAAILIAKHEGMGAVPAVALSYGLGLALSFTLQKLLTFRDRRTHHRVVLPQLAAVTALVLFNFGFTILVTVLLQHALPTVVVRTIALGVTTIWNFYLYKTRIFRVPIID